MDDPERSSETDGPSVEAVRRHLDIVERAAVQSHALKDDLGRMLFMSCLRDLHNALDGKVAGMTIPMVVKALSDLEALLRRHSTGIH